MMRTRWAGCPTGTMRAIGRSRSVTSISAPCSTARRYEDNRSFSSAMRTRFMARLGHPRLLWVKTANPAQYVGLITRPPLRYARGVLARRLAPLTLALAMLTMPSLARAHGEDEGDLPVTHFPGGGSAATDCLVG